jgi:hypothetical protein
VQERYALCHIAIFDHDPTAEHRARRTPVGETVLGRNGYELACPLIQRGVVSAERQ